MAQRQAGVPGLQPGDHGARVHIDSDECVGEGPMLVWIRIGPERVDVGALNR